MKPRIINTAAIVAVMFLSVPLCRAQYQLLNPSFESWEGTAVNAKPTGWSSFPQSDGSYASLASTSQHYQRNGGRPGHSGNKYLTIYTRSIIGIKANGNMTTGRIHAGSMSASNANNYNYTQRSSSYNHPFTGHPDSMYVWASFYAQNASSQAAIKAYIHGDSDFKDPNDTTDHSTFCAKAATQFTRTTTSSTTPQWVHLQMPFQYIGSTTANYILMSMTTNATPGGGNANDSLSVDDIEFVYSAWLDSLLINGTPLNAFARTTTTYADTLESLAALQNATVGYASQSPYATVSVVESWIDGTTRQVDLYVMSEDSTTTRHYSLTLYASAPQPCDTVSNLAYTDYGNAALVSWTAGEGNTAFEVMCFPSSDFAGDTLYRTTEDTVVMLTGLEYNTEYHILVRGLCSDSTYADWSSEMVFLTHEEPPFFCPAPGYVEADVDTPTEATLVWSIPVNEDSTLLEDATYRYFLVLGTDTLVNEVTTELSAFFTGLEAGTTYSFGVTTLCDSLHHSVPAFITFTTPSEPEGIASSTPAAWTLYPNPANNEIRIASPAAIQEVSIADLAGRTVMTSHLGSANEAVLDTRDLHPGIYLITLKTAEGQTTKRMTIAH